MRDVSVAGAAMTPFGKFLDTPLRSLAAQAVGGALEDAGLGPADVELAFFANATAGLITGQEMIRGETALRETGLLGIPIFNVENACASASSAFHLAWMAVASGQCETALVVGAEKMAHADRKRPFAALGAGIDLERRGDLETFVYGEDGTPGTGSLFMDIYALLAERYMERSGATERDFAQVAVKNHHHGALNPHAQYRDEVTVEEVLASRTISGPLKLLMCSPIGDGAAALVLRAGDGAVKVRGTALATGRDDDGPLAVERAAEKAYAQAGVGPGDVDVAEVHDAAAPAELQIYEELGLCGEGEGPAFLASGATMLGGRIPVNPSGGLLSKGHPVGATGCAQLVELTDQLRGRAGARQVQGARIALAENAGGFLGPDQAVACVTILEATG
ncbi:thiolase family protein [Baekduia soli]|uniref:propanoyl-CoA C-acyltransferase n=1 Tax=Baekduia soli TaxID=496014 RepID=A0A5B8UC54_9ACTN|nr:thiolase family protein [Baekduia soli]QEC50418.1 thiolase family protein [Baekduia soli]